jgi:hypothetical protein
VEKTSTTDMNFYNINEMFELNPKMKISLTHVSEYQVPILIIDDFYKNPELVRELIIKAPYPVLPDEEGAEFGKCKVSVSGFLKNRKFQKLYSNILKNVFHLPCEVRLRNDEFTCNTYSGTKDPNHPTYFDPHSDYNHIASVVYLNYDEEKVGGTDICRHKESGLFYFPLRDFQFNWWVEHLMRVTKKDRATIVKEEEEKINKYKDVIKFQMGFANRDEWEVIGGVESKFNRLVAYIGALLHTPVTDLYDLAHQPYSRINQVMFMEELKS